MPEHQKIPGLSSELASHNLPLSLHDPWQRGVMGEFRHWQVRVFAWNDPTHGYLVAHGLLHLQLWCSKHQISVLTPSKLTAGLYEVQTSERTYRLSSFGQLAIFLESEFDLYPPCPRWLNNLTAWMVWAPSIGAVPVSRRQ